MSNHNYQALSKHILELSEANDFATAKFEWVVDGIYYDDEWDSCPCGTPIKELCYLKNIKNGKKTYVGNVCVNQFFNINMNSLFRALDRIRKASASRPNIELFEYAKKKGYLFDGREESFYFSQIGKRIDLTVKQQEWLMKINRRIINKTVVNAKVS